MKEFLQATAVVIVILVAILGFFGFIAHLTSLLELSDQNKSARDGLVELAKRVRRMKYRLEIKDFRDKEPTKVWTDSFWTALSYFLREVSLTVDDCPSGLGNLKTKLFKGRKCVAEVKARKGWYPYFVKIHEGLTKEEYGAVKSLIAWNAVHNTAEKDKYEGTSEIKDWHEYLVKELNFEAR